MAVAEINPPGFLLDDAYELPPQVTFAQDAWGRLRRNRLALISAGLVVVLILVALVSFVWTPYPIWKQSLGPTYQPPTRQHLLGLDQAGRDILSRLMVGASISLRVGIGTMLVLSLIGVTVGLIAGYYRGLADSLISFIINIFYGIPSLLVVIIMVLIFGRSLWNVIIAIALTAWMDMARLVRGQTLSLREREFIEAARASGTSGPAILWRHLLPNAIGPIIVQATFSVPQAILFEAFLSFLGLGVAPPTPSWGAMAADGYHAMQLAPHIVIFPALALSLTLMAFNFLGDGLRDALDPRMRK